jgi:hypothetical protein
MKALELGGEIFGNFPAGSLPQPSPKFPKIIKALGGFSGGIFRIENGKSPHGFPGGFSGAASLTS